MERFRQERLDAYRAFEETQLAQWLGKAKNWPIYSDDLRHVRCGARACRQNIYFMTDPVGQPFIYSEEEITALIIAHIRQVHSGQRESEILGDTVRGHVDGLGNDRSNRHIDQGGNP